MQGDGKAELRAEITVLKQHIEDIHSMIRTLHDDIIHLRLRVEELR